MEIKELKEVLKEQGKDLTPTKIAEFFDLNYNSFANSSAKERYENALCKFYEFLKKRKV